MSLETKQFEFGEFVLDTKEKVLLRQGKSLSITPKIFQLLFILVENHGHIVEKQTLMDTVWADSFVEESNLTFTVRQLRKVLGEDTRNPRFIETVPRRGYRFIASVADLKGNHAKPIHFADTDKTQPAAFRSRPVVYTIAALLAVLALGFLFLREQGFYASKQLAFSGSAGSLKFETILSSDRAMSAVISPDGRNMAYTVIINSQQSIWLRQMSSGINRQIVPPSDNVTIFGIQFSGSGDYIYFTRRRGEEPARLDRVSVNGGVIKTDILRNLDGSFRISPDDTSIAFKGRKDFYQSTLKIASIDGTNERTIFVAPKTITDIAFSPDGKTIAFCGGQSDTGEQDFGVYTIDVENGEVAPVTDFKWAHIKGVLWLPDRSGLLVTARSRSDWNQLWKISLQTGDVKQITDSQNSLGSISATRDLSQIIVTQIKNSGTLYTASTADPNNIRPVGRAFGGLDWTLDGKILYSTFSGSTDIWLLDSDKIGQKQLTTEESTDFDPKGSPDGRSIVFVSDRSGKYSLWRMTADGGDPVQLTPDLASKSPVFTPDRKLVLFNKSDDETLWEVPADGGRPPVQLSTQRVKNISLSSDGSKFAYFVRIDNKPMIVVKVFPNDQVLHEFEIPDTIFAGGDIVWNKDDSGLIYGAADGNLVGNLWEQPLDGSQPKKLTNYPADEIFTFGFSRDYTELALIRGSWNHDVLSMKGLN